MGTGAGLVNTGGSGAVAGCTGRRPFHAGRGSPNGLKAPHIVTLQLISLSNLLDHAEELGRDSEMTTYRRLADDLLRDAGKKLTSGQQLFDAGSHGDAYNISGYAVELALKAVLAHRYYGGVWSKNRRSRRHFSHDLLFLLIEADLKGALDQRGSMDGDFALNWTTVKDWNEEVRYRTYSIISDNAQGFLSAIGDQRSGILPWIVSCLTAG